MIRRLILGLAALATLITAPAALAFDPALTYRQGSFVVSPEAGYGWQFNLQDHRVITGVEFVNIGVRLGWLPFSPLGPGPLRGSLELGLEPLYLRYTEPRAAFFAGLGLTGRYHFLSLGRFVPYVEAALFAGGTDLEIREIASDFTFLVWGGAGVSYFVTDRTALYGGYRFQHVSNGNTDRPNRGFESHTAVAGVSIFFQ